MTEKAYSDVNANSSQQYVFKVVTSATKSDIKVAVERFFNVKVDSVRTLNVYNKTKMFKRVAGTRRSWKKAYVQLKDGYKLDFIGAVE